MAAKSKSAKYYASHPEARRKKKAYDTKYHKSKKRRKYRSKLNQERRKRGIYGKGGGDLHHKKDGGFRQENPSKNRGRKEKSRLKGSKRRKR
jgi:hypothetical protein